jgi:hypothetical protein
VILVEIVCGLFDVGKPIAWVSEGREISSSRPHQVFFILEILALQYNHHIEPPTTTPKIPP